MYVSGNVLTFATRLHQLSNDSQSLLSFRTEANSYLTGLDKHISGKWEQEARMQHYRFSGQSGLMTQQFGNNGVSVSAITSALPVFSTLVANLIIFATDAPYQTNWKILSYRGVGGNFVNTPTFSLTAPNLTGIYTETGLPGLTVSFQAQYVDENNVTGQMNTPQSFVISI